MVIGVLVPPSVLPLQRVSPALRCFFVQRRPGEVLRRLPLPLYIAITTVLWLLVITAGLQLVPALFLGTAYFESYTIGAFARDTLFALGISLLNNSIYRIRSVVGPGVFMRFLLGRYHRPRREHRVFMFLDMADSTRLAELMGDIKVQSLISRFFFDIAQPVKHHRGETHRYIGDEVVVTWRMRSEAERARCIQCIVDIRQRMAQRQDWYHRKFGTVPRFRIGVHCGPVVASEVGDSKREIVYFGDTINTAARLCSACKDADVDVLVSAALVDQIEMPDGIRATALPPVELAGKSQPVDVYALA
jgi:class 3 adenylate cyclase